MRLSLDGGDAANACVTAPTITTTTTTSMRAAMRTTAQPYREQRGAASRIQAARSPASAWTVTPRRKPTSRIRSGGSPAGDAGARTVDAGLERVRYILTAGRILAIHVASHPCWDPCEHSAAVLFALRLMLKGARAWSVSSLGVPIYAKPTADAWAPEPCFRRQVRRHHRAHLLCDWRSFRPNHTESHNRSRGQARPRPNT